MMNQYLCRKNPVPQFLATTKHYRFDLGVLMNCTGAPVVDHSNHSSCPTLHIDD